MNEKQKRIQEVSLEILQEFIRICDKYQLTYFAAFGTAIGTVRHQGFIPWDDDMDVVMPRKDYDKFIEIYESEIQDSFDVYGAEIQMKVQGFYLQIFKKGTTFMTKGNTKWELHPGIKLDIFPYDCVPMNAKERASLYRKTKILNILYIIKNVKVPYMADQGMESKLVGLGCTMVYHILNLTGVSRERLVKKYLQLVKSYEGKSSCRTIINDFTPDKWVIFDHEILPLQEGVFEGITVKLPAKNHEILTRHYGDYMQLPPESERVGHDLMEIDA